MSKIDRGKSLRLKKCALLANAHANEKILDLGCGDMLLKSILPSCEYTGIDINGGDTIHNLENGLPNSIKNKKFDVVFMTEIIEHIENFKSLLMECKERLDGKGRIVISTPSNNRILYGDFFKGIGEDVQHIHSFRKTNMRNLAKVCGLQISKIEGTYIRIPPLFHKYVIIPTNQTIYTEVIIYLLKAL